jgi:two-component system cell cycle response regulator DivK
LWPGSKLKRVKVSTKDRSKTILYIEDDLSNRTLVKRVLEAEGYRVVEAEDGQQGLEMARAKQPALILVDISMPDMDGYEVTARLRAMPELGSVPIIAVTAHVLKGDRERTLAAGCAAYIQKPIDVDLLPAQLAAHLGQQ